MSADGSPRPAVEGLVAYLAALAGSAPADQLLELRYRRSQGGMGQRFFPVERPDAAAAAIAVLGRRQDVYVGAALRARREGTREALAGGWSLWADCDDERATQALEAFSPAPAIAVRSSARGVHAYWPLTGPLCADELERANRRLAAALGACQSAVTGAAAVLRPPTTLNHKYEPPAPVVLERFTGERFDADQVLEALPELTEPTQLAPVPTRLDDSDDPLRQIEPATYVAALAGREAGRDRKVACPLHPDRTPSFHVYKTPEDGWYCFGCRHGGSIYDLAGPLLGLSTRGREFLELRRRLYELLLPGREPPAPRRRRRRRVPSAR